jgi:hypothetical protein
MPYTYDFIVVDPIASADLRKELSRASSCDLRVAEGAVDVLVVPAARCFPTGVIESHGRGIRFSPGDLLDPG